jgi:hypothetical protein
VYRVLTPECALLGQHVDIEPFALKVDVEGVKLSLHAPGWGYGRTIGENGQDSHPAWPSVLGSTKKQRRKLAWWRATRVRVGSFPVLDLWQR